MTAQGPEQGGRRSADERGRRLDVTLVLAVVLPLLTVGALALVGDPADTGQDRPPTSAPLTRTTMVCPSPAGEGAADDTVALAHSDARLRGPVEQRVPGRGSVELAAGRTTTLAAGQRNGPVVLVAEGELAPGPLAGRWDEAGATACTEPEPEAWFTGVGAGPERSSVLELVNPDNGPAVADVSVLTPTGVDDVPSLRGIRVPGRSSLTFDLGKLAPSEQDVALRVEVVRGRLGSSVLAVSDPVGGSVTRSRVPGQPAPATTSYLPGVAADWDGTVLSVANPGTDEARVRLELVSGRSEFAPADVEEVRVAPGTVEQVDLDEVLGGEAGQDTVALRLDSTTPVTAAVAGTRDGSRVHAVTGTPLDDRGGAVLPEGPKRVVLAGQPGLGTARVVARDRDGKVVEDAEVEVDPGRAVVVDLPASAQVVVVTLERTRAVAVVEVRGPRPSLVPVVPLPLTGQVPDVRPALD